MFCEAGALGLTCFISSLALFSLLYLTGLVLGFTTNIWGIVFWGPTLYFCLLNVFLKYKYRNFLYDVSVRATFLGCTFATGIYLSLNNNCLRTFGMYAAVMSFFHFSEFYAIAVTNPKTLSIDSFILNHSMQYAAAAVLSWIEWGCEAFFFPELKTHYLISYFGLILCLSGELLRKGAMYTAKTNFNHLVQYQKAQDHMLVTHGVYAFCRHPSYVGWFYWSIGTQIILLNPFCVIIYTLASWMFFKERVFSEEATLLEFFGPSYKDYQDKVGTGLPFIKGYVWDSQDD